LNLPSELIVARLKPGSGATSRISMASTELSITPCPQPVLKDVHESEAIKHINNPLVADDRNRGIG